MSALTPTNLILEYREKYLYVEYSGDQLTLEMIVTIINKVAAEIREANIKNVLIVRNAPLLESDASRELVASMIRRVVAEDVRFAIVDIYGNDPKAVRHAVEASRQAGCNLTGFDTIDDAVAWLDK